MDRILTALKAGASHEAAAIRGGVHVATFYRWMEKGEAAKTGQYREFHDAVKEAEAEAEVALVAKIRRHGDDSWQANAWLLERRHPDRYGRRERVDQTVDHRGADVNIVIKRVPMREDD